ncbi:MAG: hypothetical protein J6V00_05220 [Bacteroidaceae bacterium]|nr:hypothetical protein [Bacteroidaceae bacterium]
MIYGTHNSATGGKLLWWLKPLAWLINPTSKCQDRTIADQLSDGVKLFNLQVAYVGGKWRFSHGLAIYKEDVIETLAMMKACATKDEPIYVQLYLDRCFWCKLDIEEFEFLIEQLKVELCSDEFIMLDSWVEGTKYHPYCSGVRISLEEHYWSLGWGKMFGKTWLDKLPLPKRHAKKYNAKYKSECEKEYLMLDYYNYE